MLSLRPYQQDAVDGIRQSYLMGKRAPMLVLPTGGGKTVVFSYIATNSAAKKKRALILVHRIELLRQTSAALKKNGVHHGLINAKYTPDPFANVQVASVQTLVKRIGRVRMDYDLIIIDECHHANASTWRHIINANPQARLLGVTATPIRGDGSSLGALSGGYFDDIVIGPDTAALIEMGFLVKPKVFAPAQRLDLSDVDMVAGDYDKKQILAKVDKPTITGDAVEHYTRLCAGDPCVVFCVSVEHAQHVADQFRAAGYRAEYADGSLDDEERQRRLNGLGNGSVQVLTTCDLVSEGTDIPAIACAIMLRPTASLGLFIQQVGRALRPSPGKDFAIILDHVGNVLTHGLPDDPRDWQLDGEKKRTKRSVNQNTVRVQQCPQCYAIHEPADTCTECGYVYKANERKQLEQNDGTLSEVTAGMKLAIQQQRKAEIARARTYEDLLAVEKARNYKAGWARHVWKSRGKRELNM